MKAIPDNYQVKSQTQKKYYNETANSYDKWHIEPASGQVVDAWNFANLQNFLKNRKIARCLDVGCGTGRLSNNLLQICQEVYGVDQSEAVLDLARQKYPALKLSCAEAVNLPYPDNHFDLVIINGSLHHFFAMEATFNEVHRVLRPGGLFVLLGEPNKKFLHIANPFFYLWVLNRIVSKIFSIFNRQTKVDSHLIEPEAESYIPKNLKQQLITAGFAIDDFYTYDYLARSENRFWLKIYYHYLNWEHRTIAKWLPDLGAAIQVMASKK